MTVGLLYDIGCQLHRSCLKYRLLDDAVLHRITFAISVFHAYGHQWACQIIYHPRKCEGFGLSDGEGCERLWSALKHLIAPLRVSGVSVLCFENGCIRAIAAHDHIDHGRIIHSPLTINYMFATY
jgi:hypothetical protein